MKGYRIYLPAFNGPLDLLLYLIERQELDITAISLARVTEQFLAQVELLKERRVEQLIDFLSVGARLVLIKSRALLPVTPSLPGAGDQEEEDPAEALIRQLRQYKRFKVAAGWLDGRVSAGLRTYLRVAPPPQLDGRLDLSGVTTTTLRAAVLGVLARAETMEASVALIQPRRLTIEDQLGRLRTRLGRKRPFLFNDILSRQRDQTEVAITLLALLELIKRREASAQQEILFGPIVIVPGAPEVVEETAIEDLEGR